MKIPAGLAVLTLAAASAYSAPSSAVVEVHANASNPAARCQSATPLSEVQISKRPLALQNDSRLAAHVTCSFEFDSGDAINYAPFMVDAYFSNSNNRPATVSCTAVTGYQGGDNEYVSVETVVQPGAAQAGLFWMDNDFANDGMATGLVSISCKLPGGVGINDTYIYWEADDAV